MAAAGDEAMIWATVGVGALAAEVALIALATWWICGKRERDAIEEERRRRREEATRALARAAKSIASMGVSAAELAEAVARLDEVFHRASRAIMDATQKGLEPDSPAENERGTDR